MCESHLSGYNPLVAHAEGRLLAQDFQKQAPMGHDRSLGSQSARVGKGTFLGGHKDDLWVGEVGPFECLNSPIGAAGSSCLGEGPLDMSWGFCSWARILGKPQLVCVSGSDCRMLCLADTGLL